MLKFFGGYRYVSNHPFQQWLKNRELRISICWRHRKRLLLDGKSYLPKVKKELGEYVDGSRITAEIALRMRLDGDAINKPINTVYRESGWAARRTSPDDRLEYVKRITHVSFGSVETLTIAQRKAKEEMRKRNIARQEEASQCMRLLQE